MSFSIGEEVIFEEERYVISEISKNEPRRFRLLASTSKGARVEWARENDIVKISRYTTPYDDTAKY
ncbi:MAG: hypothetical protein KC422_14545 [Trueperaceae bacterium]|nr:hypothetical protein [Trueperaceae bacterium]